MRQMIPLLCLSLFLALPGFANLEEDWQHANREKILRVWQKKVQSQGGVKPWTQKYVGMRVMQEWLAILSQSADASVEEKRKVGQELENYFVSNRLKPIGRIGTSLPVPGFSNGDYDMTLLWVITLLGLFEGDRDLVTDETFAYFISEIVRVWGQTPREHFRVLLLDFEETENHVLMSESARYLTNQFILMNRRGLPQLDSLKRRLEGQNFDLDNRNGLLHRFLLRYMQRIVKEGFFEFNALIYQRFTLHALDNLYSFSQGKEIATAAAILLDYAALKFSFQHLGGVRFGPFRRSSEHYDHASYLRHDAASRFFEVQRQAIEANESDGYWGLASHSGTALFSCLLKYRTPGPIGAYLRDRSGRYFMRNNLHQASGDEPIVEGYHSGNDWLISAGGHFQRHTGANFPTPKRRITGPWVYDVIARSSSLAVKRDQSPTQRSQLLRFKGKQWNQNNLATYRNFLYGYQPEGSEAEWPHFIPEEWGGRGETIELDGAELTFLEIPHKPIQLVLGKLTASKKFFPWSRSGPSRGFVEVLDSNLTLSVLKQVVLDAQADLKPSRKHFSYRLQSGEVLFLNRQYGRKARGIERVEVPGGWMENTENSQKVQTLVGQLLLEQPLFGPNAGAVARSREPLLRVWRMDKASLAEAEVVATVDGNGSLDVCHPSFGCFCADFVEWWNPSRGFCHSHVSRSSF